MPSAVTAALAADTQMTPLRRNVCVVLLVILGFSLGCSEFAVIGIETELARAFGVGLQDVGLTMSVYAAVYATCTPLLALGTGRYRRYTLLIVYSALFCAGNLLAAVAPTFALLVCARALIGSVSGAFLALGVTFLPELLGKGRTAMAIAVVYGAFSVAMVVATSAGKMVAELADWHVVMVAAFVLGVAVCAGVLAAMPREGSTDEPATVREQIGLIGESQVISGMCVFIFGIGSVYVFYGYITPYLEEVLGMTALGASGVLMAYGVMCLISNLAAGVLDTHFGMRTLVPGFIVQALILVGLFLAGGNRLIALALIMALGLSMYLVSVPCISMFMDTAYRRHPKALTLASSLEPMAFNVGIAFGTAVGGVVVAGPGMHFAGLVGGAFSLVACMLVALTMRLEARARGGARSAR